MMLAEVSRADLTSGGWPTAAWLNRAASELHLMSGDAVGSNSRPRLRRREGGGRGQLGVLSAGLPADAVVAPAWLCLEYRAVGCRAK